jgi:hypothetical protein
LIPLPPTPSHPPSCSVQWYTLLHLLHGGTPSYHSCTVVHPSTPPAQWYIPLPLLHSGTSLYLSCTVVHPPTSPARWYILLPLLHSGTSLYPSCTVVRLLSPPVPMVHPTPLPFLHSGTPLSSPSQWYRTSPFFFQGSLPLSVQWHVYKTDPSDKRAAGPKGAA